MQYIQHTGTVPGTTDYFSFRQELNVQVQSRHRQYVIIIFFIKMINCNILTESGNDKVKIIQVVIVEGLGDLEIRT